ncbi:MAG: hypothetical protein JNJ61_14620 [Anaerolineae bacterium]|nr:hypothetical protein [Anaerolineae bacterium]
MQYPNRFQNRSYFWPLILIGVGVIWLLTNIGILQSANMQVLLRLWPLVLIVIGVEILLRRSQPQLATWIGIGAVVLIVALMLVGPAIGLIRTVEVKTGNYEETLGDAQSARVTLNLSVADTTVTPLNDSNELFQADVRYLGELNFNVSGGSERVISLTQSDQTTSWNWDIFTAEPNLRWDVALSPAVPIDLDINGGVGNTRLELNELQLSNVRVQGGVGDVYMELPAMSETYNVSVNGGTGSSEIIISEGAALHITVSGGVGDVRIDVPDNAAVRVDASTGVGDINLPREFTRISGGDDQFVGESGVWQTEGFASAERQISIEFDGGVGQLTIR